MTLEEVVKTGKKFTRPSFNGWIVLDTSKEQSNSDIYVWEETRIIKAFAPDDVLVNDWYTEPLPINADQLRKAFALVYQTCNHYSLSEMVDNVCRELGLL